MKLIKFITIFLPLFIFFGCGNLSQEKFRTKSGKEILTQKNTKWYDIDSTQNRFAIYEFSSTQLHEKLYINKTFTKVKDENFYPINFSDNDHFQMLKDGITYSCEISTCEDDNFIGIYCTPNVSGMDSIMLCGWNSKQKAITNMP